MNIPHFQDLRKPILQLMCDGQIRRKSDLTQPLAQHFGLTDEQVAHEYESKNGSMFVDRISWAVSYLSLSGLLTRPQRGQYVISDLGREFAEQAPENINAYIKQKMSERSRSQQAEQSTDTTPSIEIDQSESTPQEQLYASYEAIRQDVYEEIIDTILSKTPAAFERLVVELLQKMGYGGAVEKSGRVTRLSKDGGIDGEIYEDVLGLGRIHIQAKRYQRDAVIGRPDIQSFAGALLGSNANKGVFITTARFSPEAKEYAQSLPSARVVLIDGLKLAEYMYQYGLGVQIEQTISLKKLDNDYWDSLPNNPQAQ